MSSVWDASSPTENGNLEIATSLDFDDAYRIGEQLWAFGKVLHEDPKYVKPPRWILTYRYPVRAMVARIVSIDRDYIGLNTLGVGTAPVEEMTTPEIRNEWNIVWESYVGVLFFAMDSSLECFTYALNALGYLLSADDFIDITTDTALKRITPANLLDPPTRESSRHSVYEACRKYFPKICGHWSANRALIAQIIEYHDATKHRHSAAIGQAKGIPIHVLKPEPKRSMESIAINESTGHIAHNEAHCLQSITMAYRVFMVEWLRIARQELESVFGRELPPVEGCR